MSSQLFAVLGTHAGRCYNIWL